MDSFLVVIDSLKKANFGTFFFATQLFKIKEPPNPLKTLSNPNRTKQPSFTPLKLLDEKKED